MSPADRLFGWVPQGQGSDEGYKSRIRVVCEESSRPEIIQRFNGGNLPLTILGQPKPAQGRFYVADNQGKPQHEVDKTDAGYDASQGKSLRGRKQYWHHKGLEANKAKAYWHPSAEDRTQTKHDNRYQNTAAPIEMASSKRIHKTDLLRGGLSPVLSLQYPCTCKTCNPRKLARCSGCCHSLRAITSSWDMESL